MGGGLPPVAVNQSTTLHLKHRQRRQASSHIGFVYDLSLYFLETPSCPTSSWSKTTPHSPELIASYLERNGYSRQRDQPWRSCARTRAPQSAGPGDPRPDAAGARRAASVPPVARRFGEPADPDAHRPRRQPRPGAGPGNGRRRLRHQTLRASRAAGPGAHLAAAQQLSASHRPPTTGS